MNCYVITAVCFFFTLPSLGVRCVCVIVAAGFLFVSFDFLCHISLFTQIAFIQSYVTKPISTVNTEAQHNHPLDRHTPYLVHILILVIDTDTDTRERLQIVLFFLLPPSHRLLKTFISIAYQCFDVYVFRCVCLFSHVNFMPIY